MSKKKKYSRDLDEDLKSKVRALAAEKIENSITIEPIKLNSKKAYGEVVKSNEITSIFTGNPDMVCVALNEELFAILDEETQDILIRNLLSTIRYDNEKEKVMINKPEIMFTIEMLHDYKGVVAQKIEIAYHGLQQLEEMRREAKEAEKAAKAEKKRNKEA